MSPPYQGTPLSLTGLQMNFGPQDPDFEKELYHRVSCIVRYVFGVDKCQVNIMTTGSRNLIIGVQLPTSRPRHASRTCLFRLANTDKETSAISAQSEVDTMLYLAHHPEIRIPIPKLYAYDTGTSLMSATFMIIEYISTGVPLLEAFDNLTLPERDRLLRDYARIIYQLSLCRFPTSAGIGSLYRSPTGSFQVGALSSYRTNQAERQSLPTAAELARPFPSVEKWLTTIERDNKLLLEKYPLLDRQGAETEQQALKRVARCVETVKRMMQVIPFVTAAKKGSELEQLSSVLCLFHVDMHPQNILVLPSGDQAGRIVSVLDWEEAAVVPLWKLVSLPCWLTHSTTGDPRSPADIARDRDVIRSTLSQLDSTGLLVKAMDKKYDLLRKVAQAASFPWWMSPMRDEVLEAVYGQQRAGLRVLGQGSKGGYATDFVGSSRKGARREGKSAKTC